MAILTERFKRLHAMLKERRREAETTLSALKGGDVEPEFVRRYEQNLWKFDAALRNLEDDHFGICEGCLGEIEEDRLWALPLTKTCRGCYRKRVIADLERLEKQRRPGGHLFD